MYNKTHDYHNGEWSNFPEVGDTMFQVQQTNINTNKISHCEKHLETARLNNIKSVSLFWDLLNY